MDDRIAWDRLNMVRDYLYMFTDKCKWTIIQEIIYGNYDNQSYDEYVREWKERHGSV